MPPGGMRETFFRVAAVMNGFRTIGKQQNKRSLLYIKERAFYARLKYNGERLICKGELLGGHAAFYCSGGEDCAPAFGYSAGSAGV